MARAQPRTASQSTEVADRVREQHMRIQPRGVREQAPPERAVVPSADGVCRDRHRRRRRKRAGVGRAIQRPAAEQPDRTLAERLQVPLDEAVRVALPVGRIQGAAQHDGAVGGEIPDLRAGLTVDLETGPPRTSPIASAISRVEPCLLAYATRTRVRTISSCSALTDRPPLQIRHGEGHDHDRHGRDDLHDPDVDRPQRLRAACPAPLHDRKGGGPHRQARGHRGVRPREGEQRRHRESHVEPHRQRRERLVAPLSQHGPHDQHRAEEVPGRDQRVGDHGLDLERTGHPGRRRHEDQGLHDL